MAWFAVCAWYALLGTVSVVLFLLVLTLATFLVTTTYFNAKLQHMIEIDKLANEHNRNERSCKCPNE